MEYDAVIVGAGAAGAIAARDLARGGCRVALLEASDRYGGRMRTIAGRRAGAPVELGAEFVHGRPASTLALMRECGQRDIANGEVSFSMRDGFMRSQDGDPFESVTAFLATALERMDDESVAALVARGLSNGLSQDVATRTLRLVAGFDAADPARASARAIAHEWAGDAAAGGAQSRPLQGYAPLVDHLARSLDPKRVNVHLRTAATRVVREATGLTVNARGVTGTATFRAKHAVIAVPHGVLALPAADDGAIAFDPPLPASTRAAIDGIAMGPVVKVVLSFREPFWETLNGGAWRDGAFFSGDGAFPTMWTQMPVRAKTLVAWAGGTAAVPLRNLPAGALTERAIADAGRYFGDERAVRQSFEEAHVHDWQSDPMYRGAYTYVITGGEYAREALGVPIDGNLWIAGEATATDGEGGTVAGALESGMRAARGVLRALGASA